MLISLNIFEKIYEYYRIEFLEPRKKNFPGYENDIYDSLCFFLDGYAFARQGSSQNYPVVSIDVIRECKKEGKSLDDKEIWSSIYERLIESSFKKDQDPKANPSRNPMCYKGFNGVRKVSLISFINNNGLNDPIVTWAKTLIFNSNLDKAYNEFFDKGRNRINGINSKIISLFLRDVYLMYGNDKSLNKEDRKFLQPIDIWIARVISILENPMKYLNPNRDRDYIQEKMLELFEYPEKANAGIWYFCGRVCGSSSYLVKKSIENNEIVKLVSEFVSKRNNLVIPNFDDIIKASN